MQARFWRHKNDFIVYDGERIETPAVELFDAQWWRDQGLTQGSFDGRAKVHVVRYGEQRWVLRRYLRGGLVAKISGDAYLWTGLEATRPWREWHLLAALRERGLPVPHPVAAHVRRDGWRYSAHLLTALIDGARPFSDLLAQGEARREDWQRIGLTLRRFCEAGVHHPDLNVRNILIDLSSAARDVYLLDFDKGHLDSDAAQFQRDIDRLKRSVDKFSAQQPDVRVSAADWQALLDACGS